MKSFIDYYLSIYPVAVVYHFCLTISINLYLSENFIRKLNFKKQEICFKPSWGQILDQQNKKNWAENLKTSFRKDSALT